MEENTTTESIAPRGAVGEIRFCATGAVIDGQPSEHTVELALEQLSQVEEAALFAIGDLINFAEGRWGEKYARWSEITGKKIDRIYKIAAVCRSIPPELRRSETLTFEHHFEVKKLQPEDQKKWLDIAESHNLSKDRLRQSIKLGRVATKKDMQPPSALPANDRGIDNIHPHVNRLYSYISKREREGEYAELDVEGCYRFHLDLEPIVKSYTNILARIREIGDEAVNQDLDRDLMDMGLVFRPQDDVVTVELASED